MTSALILFIGLAMGFNLLALASSRLPSVIRAAAMQGMVLGILPLLIENEFQWMVGIVAVGTIAVKGFVIPHLLRRALRAANIDREVKPLIGFVPSLLLGAAATIGAVALGGALALPAYLRAEPAPIKVGILQPVTGAIAFEGTAQHRGHGEVDLERHFVDRHQRQRHRDARADFAAQGRGHGVATAHDVDLGERGVHQQALGVAQPVGRQGPPPGERRGVFRIEGPRPLGRRAAPASPSGGTGGVRRARTRDGRSGGLAPDLIGGNLVLLAVVVRPVKIGVGGGGDGCVRRLPELLLRHVSCV